MDPYDVHELLGQANGSEALASLQIRFAKFTPEVLLTEVQGRFAATVAPRENGQVQHTPS